MSLPDPVFPPLLNGHAVDAGRSAFQDALAGASQGRFAAGDILWSRREREASCAIVLEPDVALARAIEMAPLAMVALGDAIGAIGPPNLGIMYRWPFEVLANGGRVGRVRLGYPLEAGAGDVPDYLVTGIEIAIERDTSTAEPGHDLRRTALHEEGAGDLDRTQIIEAYARHLLTWITRWESDGFEPVGELWLFRAADRNRMTRVKAGGLELEGRLVGLDAGGGAVIETGTDTRTVPLTDAVFAGHKDRHD